MQTTAELRTFLGMPAILASPAMRDLLNVVERVAQTSASVLIHGESGTGKELIARAIHYYSLRSGKPWIDVSCAALPEHLIESELFGYEKGAFSGAESSKPGLFELAHSGTLFLDEIGELDARMQAKLLRVLDGTPYYRLGGTKKVSVDTRIVAATNQKLGEMVEDGKFRGDLYHRLCQITLKVPPLRERREAILPLATHFLRTLKPNSRFTPEAISLLKSYHWPGNVRELRNVVTNAGVMTNSDEIHSSDLTFDFVRRPASREAIVIDQFENHNLDGIERRMIMKVLAQTHGHHQRAAEMLGISRRTLSRKLKVYEIESSSRSVAS